MNDELEKRTTKKQRELLEFIRSFVQERGYGPSYREIMRALNYKSVSTVAVHVNGLLAKGKLEKKGRSARSLAVTEEDSPPPVSAAAPSGTDWLAAEVEARFAAYDDKPTPKKLDDLYVLVGAMHILGMTDAARAGKARLRALAKHQ